MLEGYNHEQWNNPHYASLRAEYELGIGNRAAAEHWFQDAFAQKSTQPDMDATTIASYAIDIGDIYRSKGMLESATNWYTIARETSPNDANIAVAADGVNLLFAREFVKAQDLLREALQNYPTDARLHRLLGVAHAFNSEYGEAVVELRKALEYAPDNLLYMVEIANALECNGAVQEAEAIREHIYTAHDVQAVDGLTPLLTACSP
jgi:Flp pilus assembly protein TadD